MSDGAPIYFAVLDPLDPGITTLWYRSLRGRDAGRIKELGPRYRRSIKHTDIPHSRGSADADAWLLDYWQRARAAREQIVASIEADPMPAAALFATTANKCIYCGHMLTDPESRAGGVGPECIKRRAYPEVQAVIAKMIAEIRSEVRS